MTNPIAPEQNAARAKQLYLLILLLTVGVATWLRISKLGHPMRFDESYTFLYFAGPDEPWGVFQRYNPNNHVLLTLLVRACYALGGMAPEIIRAPTLLIGVALVAAAAELARRMNGLLAALGAGMLAATSSILIEYSVNARGYGPVALMTLLMAICTHRILQAPRERLPWLAWGLTAAFGAFFMPIMLFPAVFFLMVIALQTRMSFQFFPFVQIGCTVAGSVLLTLILYSPILYFNGWRSLLANKWIEPKAFSEVVAGVPRIGMETLGHWLRDTSTLWAALVVAGLVASLVYGIKKRSLLHCTPVLFPLTAVVMTLAQRLLPYPRVWLFLLPLLLVYAACGWAWLAQSTRFSQRILAPLFVLLFLGVSVDAGLKTLANPYLISEDSAVLVDAESIVKDALGAELDNSRTALVWDNQVPTWPPLAYYLILYCPPDRLFTDYKSRACQQALLVVGEGQTVERLYSDMPGMDEYGAPTVWRNYPRATVYQAKRKAPPQP